MSRGDQEDDGFVERLERALRDSGASDAEIAAVLRYLREAGTSDKRGPDTGTDSGAWRTRLDGYDVRRRA